MFFRYLLSAARALLAFLLHFMCFHFSRVCFQVMPKGKGLLSQGVAFSTSLFTDVAGVAMQGVRQVSSLPLLRACCMPPRRCTCCATAAKAS